MSAFLLSENRIAQLADYLRTLNNCGFDFFGYDMPQDLKTELFDCRDIFGNTTTKKIFEKLYNLNAAAVSGRYNEEMSPAPDMPKFAAIHKPREAAHDETIARWYDEIKPWHFELLKLFQCFLYQCDEDTTRETDLFKALKSLENTMLNHIVANNPEWIKANWG